MGFSPDGYLDFHLLLSEQYVAFETLYAPNGEYKANINRVVDFNPTDDKDQPVTLADLIAYYIDHPIGQMTEAKAIVDNFKYYHKLITEKWGAKHYAGLTEEERSGNK